MLRIGFLISGGGTNMQSVIDGVNEGYINGQIVTVVSSNPKAYGIERAKNAGIAAIVMRKKDYELPGSYEKALIKHFEEMKVDLIVLAGFLVILDADFVKAFPNRILNIHPSLIPSFCGKGFYGIHVHKAVLEKGVKLTGATVHIATEEADDGPIILQKAVEVKDGDTAEILQKRVMEEAEWFILKEAVRLFADKKIEIIGNRAITK